MNIKRDEVVKISVHDRVSVIADHIREKYQIDLKQSMPFFESEGKIVPDDYLIGLVRKID